MGTPTWKNIRYATHIDLTLSNEKMKGKIEGWKANFDIASTDHAICKVDLKYQGGPLIKRVKSTNIKAFQENLGGKEWDEPKKWTAEKLDLEAGKSNDTYKGKVGTIFAIQQTKRI